MVPNERQTLVTKTIVVHVLAPDQCVRATVKVNILSTFRCRPTPDFRAGFPQSDILPTFVAVEVHRTVSTISFNRTVERQ